MDQLVSATEANRHFPKLLRQVAMGVSFTITLRGRPVARVVPVDGEEQRRSAE